ncbi:MAG TPA: ribosome-binding factor A [Patescibacteria group bacterium]|nr:ribosome-binding factor A [Patescibacteria group bacterium]
MSSQERLNSLLKTEIAKIVNQEIIIPGVLLTILRVSSDDRGSFLKVELSVLPSTKAGTALNSLRKNSKSIAKKLQTKTRLKRIPKLDWNLDLYNSSDYELDKIFKQIEDEKNE